MPKVSFQEETVDLKIASQRVLSGGRWREMSLSGLSLAMSQNMTGCSLRRVQPQARAEGDLEVEFSAS